MLNLSRYLAMTRPEIYVDLDGQTIWLHGLEEEERNLVALLQARARTHPDWTDFANFWIKAVAGFYDGRGLPRKEMVKTAPYRIGCDLESRLGIAAGMVALGDYRGDLELIMHTQFKSQRAFCETTGL